MKQNLCLFLFYNLHAFYISVKIVTKILIELFWRIILNCRCDFVCRESKEIERDHRWHIQTKVKFATFVLLHI